MAIATYSTSELQYRDNGKENVLGFYTDNGKENGNYYSGFRASPLSKREHNILVCLRCWELLASISMMMMMMTVMVARSVHHPVCGASRSA